MALYKETSKGSTKYPLNQTAVATCWTGDGLRFAIGYENGFLQIKDKENEKEIKKIVLNNNIQEKILCLTFSSTRFRNKEYVLYVGTWEKNVYIVEVCIILNFNILLVV